MNDMSIAIIPRSDQINAEDFIAGPRTFTIESVAITAGAEQPVSIKMEGEPRVWRPCKSMSRCLVAAWGADASLYAGRSVTLYRDPDVKWGGLAVGGIRVSHMSDIKATMVLALTMTKGSKKPFTVKPLAKTDAKPAAEDKVAEGVRVLIANIKAAAGDEEKLKGITGDVTVVNQRKWLADKRPDLAQAVDAAVAQALAPLDGDDTPFATDRMET